MVNKLGYISVMLMIALGHHHLHGQNTSKIIWHTWEEVINKSKVQKKLVFVDIYTENCGWCRKMDATTFLNNDIADFINKNFYAIRFNAKEKENITLNDRVYKYKDGLHELAVEIMLGRISVPTLVFMDENFSLLQPIPGFRGPSELNMILHYYAGGYNKTTPWQLFINNFNSIITKDKDGVQYIKGKN